MKSRKREAIGVLLLLMIIVASVFQSNNVMAEESDHSDASENESSDENVRVGYYYCDLFQEGMDDDAVKSGYSYDYLQKLAEYTGWHYIYVYGDWATLLQALEDGEIDVLAGVSITDERLEYISFPDYTMGADYYYLYKHYEDQNITTDDLSTINGKKIGAIKNNLMSTYLLDWVEEKGLTPEIIYYDSFTDRDADFEAGNLDMIVTTDNNVLNNSGYEPLAKLGEEPYYLAVTKDREDLLAQLNQGLSKMHDLEPYYLENLQYASYGNTTTTSRLSAEEDDWINVHGTIKVGYIVNYLPYSDERDGQARGLIVDVFNEMLEQLSLKERLTVDYIAYDTYDELLDALHAGDVDTIFPVGGASWYQERDGVDATSPVVVSGMDVVYKGEYSDRVFDTIALNENNKLTYYYALTNYIDSEYVFYDSTEECLDAVESGKVTGTFINGLRIDAVVKNSAYSDLSVALLEKTVTRCLGVEDGNSTLLILLNRGLNAIGSEYGINASYNYVDELYSTSFEDVIRENFRIILAIIIVVVAIILLLAVSTITRMHSEAVDREKYLKELEAAHRDTMAARQESNTDELTGFYNRRAYETALKVAEAEGITDDFAIVSMDVNGLKNVNDNMGHQAGDELIKGAAQCMEKVFKQFGNIFRTGGDEFIALLTIKEEDLQKEVKTFELVTKGWSGVAVKSLSISVGYVSKSEFPDSDLKNLEVIADKRMYENKSLYYFTSGKERRDSKRDAYFKLFRTFEKVIKVDLETDTYQLLKLNANEHNDERGFKLKFSEWAEEFANSGQIHEDDLAEYKSKLNVGYIQGQLMAGVESIKIFYRRRIHDEFHKVFLEIIPEDGFGESNLIVFLYVKDVSE